MTCKKYYAGSQARLGQVLRAKVRRDGTPIQPLRRCSGCLVLPQKQKKKNKKHVKRKNKQKTVAASHIAGPGEPEGYDNTDAAFAEGSHISRPGEPEGYGNNQITISYYDVIKIFRSSIPLSRVKKTKKLMMR